MSREDQLRPHLPRLTGNLATAVEELLKAIAAAPSIEAVRESPAHRLAVEMKKEIDVWTESVATDGRG
jgi:hypothetical protein